MGTKLMLTDVRCSFLVLGDPEDYQGNKKFRWSATALVPNGSPQFKAVMAALKATAEEKWGAKAAKALEAILPDAKACCWVDGKRKDYDGYEGHFALSAHRPQKDGRPLVLDRDKSPIYKPDNTLYEGKGGVVYSGCFVNMHVEFWAQDNANGKALRAGLLGIQKVRDGDAFGGGSKPSDDAFGEITEGADAGDLT
jgi:hypothetical protein